MYQAHSWQLEDSSLWQRSLPVAGVYRHHIDLTGLKAVDLESGELCLAFWGGYMLWVIEDKISFSYDPTNPLQQ